MDQKGTLKELAALFLKLGIIGFGGPAVHIAMMEAEVVEKRKWISPQHFLDLVGATNLIPGPNSTEMAMHIGQERGGRKGLVVAGLCFIVPAVVITGLIAWAYARWGQLPQVQPYIYGVKPAIISVIAVTMFRLGKKALKSFLLGVIGALAFVTVLLGANEIFVLFGAGLVGLLLHLSLRRDRLPGVLPFFLLQSASVLQSKSSWALFLTFLKIGSILYGSGYVLFAFLDAELVAKGLLTKQALIDAIAVGQFTPGPVFSSATFIGWQMGGFPSAMAATLGIFLPSFLFVALLNPLIPRLRSSDLMSAFLDAVNIASIAIVLSVLVEMGRETLLDWRTTMVAAVAFMITMVFPKLNTAFLVIGGALLGYLLWLMF